MVVSDPFIAPALIIHPEHDLAFGKGLHGLWVQFHAPDGRDVGAAPVQIQPPVVIQKKVGIPEGKGAGDFLKGLVDRVLCAVEIADFVSSGSTEIQPIAHGPHVRRVIENGNRRFQGMVCPVAQITAFIESRRHGRKQVIFPFEISQGWVCRFPINRHFPIPKEGQIGLYEIVFIRQVHGIADVFFHRILSFSAGVDYSISNT